MSLTLAHFMFCHHQGGLTEKLWTEMGIRGTSVFILIQIITLCDCINTNTQVQGRQTCRETQDLLARGGGTEKCLWFDEVCGPVYLAFWDFLGRSTAWMLGSTPPWAMVTPDRSLFNSSSLRMASWR